MGLTCKARPGPVCTPRCVGPLAGAAQTPGGTGRGRSSGRSVSGVPRDPSLSLSGQCSPRTSTSWVPGGPAPWRPGPPRPSGPSEGPL